MKCYISITKNEEDLCTDMEQLPKYTVTQKNKMQDCLCDCHSHENAHSDLLPPGG